jgi:hypothetical protein
MDAPGACTSLPAVSIAPASVTSFTKYTVENSKAAELLGHPNRLSSENHYSINERELSQLSSETFKVLFNRWQKARKERTFLVTVPIDKLEEAVARIKSLGYRVQKRGE